MTREHEVLFSAVMSMTGTSNSHQPETKHDDDDW
jgi:hypothetical protein